MVPPVFNRTGRNLRAGNNKALNFINRTPSTPNGTKAFFSPVRSGDAGGPGGGIGGGWDGESIYPSSGRPADGRPDAPGKAVTKSVHLRLGRSAGRPSGVDFGFHRVARSGVREFNAGRGLSAHRSAASTSGRSAFLSSKCRTGNPLRIVRNPGGRVKAGLRRGPWPNGCPGAVAVRMRQEPRAPH